jgi:glycosyltransferase involved in cell wall biosynthesis
MSLHVLVIPSWYPESPADIRGSFFREQAIALKEHGCDVGVITVQLRSLRLRFKVLSGSRGIFFEKDDGVWTYRKFAINWLPKLPLLRANLWSFYCGRLFKAYVREYGLPDVIHVHAIFDAGVAALKIHKKYGVPYVITEHSSAFARASFSNRKRKMATKLAQTAWRRFAVSSSFSKFLSSYLERSAGNWEVLPNIVQKRFLCQSLGSPRDDDTNVFTFLSICMLNRNKRVDLVIKAFAAAFRGRPQIILRIGGDGDMRPELEAIACSEGISDQVEFLGLLGREQVMEQMSKMDVFVLGSEYETFAVVLIEALALGKPVIATQCGGPEDIVQSFNGLLVPVNDVDAMADAMRRMHQNHGSYRPEQIRAACESSFGAKVIVNKLIDVYRSARADHSCAYK